MPIFQNSVEEGGGLCGGGVCWPAPPPCLFLASNCSAATMSILRNAMVKMHMLEQRKFLGLFAHVCLHMFVCTCLFAHVCLHMFVAHVCLHMLEQRKFFRFVEKQQRMA